MSFRTCLLSLIVAVDGLQLPANLADKLDFNEEAILDAEEASRQYPFPQHPSPWGGTYDLRTPTNTTGPELVLVHLEKASGTFVINYLVMHAGGKLHVVNEHSVMPDELRNDKNLFRIGLVREPCDYYLSEYKWRYEGNGWLHMHLGHESKAEGEEYEQRFYSKKGDPDQFKDWLYHISGVARPGEEKPDRPTSTVDRCGLLSMRMWLQNINGKAAALINEEYGQALLLDPKNKTYKAHDTCAFMDEIAHRLGEKLEHSVCPCPLGDCARGAADKYHRICAKEVVSTNKLDNYDCWIRTDHTSEDMQECMEKFKERGGTVNMPPLDQLDTIHGNSNPADFTCSDMYDAESSKLVMSLDGGLMKKFGYKGCCKPHPSKAMVFPR